MGSRHCPAEYRALVFFVPGASPVSDALQPTAPGRDVRVHSLHQDYPTTQRESSRTGTRPPSMRTVDNTNAHLKEAKISSWDRDWLTPYVSVHEQNINAFLDAIDMSFGSMKVFLSDGLALSDQDILQLKDNFLE